MKKLLLLTLAIVTLTSLGYSQNSPTKKNGWETDNLKGKVKSFTESEYLAEDRFGEIQKTNLIEKKTYKYDDNGNLIESCIYDNGDGKLSKYFSKRIFKYDDNGNRIEVNSYGGEWFTLAEPRDPRFEGRYDTVNLRFEGKRIFKYDDNGNLIEENSYGPHFGGVLTYSIIFKYDDNGNLIESYMYNEGGSLGSKNIYKYDDKGNLIESYEGGSKLGSKNIYKYDDNGNLIESYMYNADGKLSTKFGKGIFKYDDKDNKIEEKYCNADGSLIYKDTFKYEFDEKGNWIKRITFYKKKELEEEWSRSIEEREYEYYE